MSLHPPFLSTQVAVPCTLYTVHMYIEHSLVYMCTRFSTVHVYMSTFTCVQACCTVLCFSVIDLCIWVLYMYLQINKVRKESKSIFVPFQN